MTDEMMEKELKMTDFSGAIKAELLDKLLKMRREDNRSSKLSLKRVSFEDLGYVAAAGNSDASATSKEQSDGLKTF